ncbi:MAG: hypothetical protein AB7F43_12485 [Bacteriovoracia bacterium]
MRNFIYAAFIGVLLLLASQAHARTVYFGSETETITLVYGGATLLRFPSEVKTISQARRFEISPANAEQPSYSLLSVRPRFSSGSSDVAFILNDGTIIKTKLVVVSNAIPEKTDAIYDFKNKGTLLANEGEKTGSGLSELELMKAMIRDDRVSGYEVRNLVRTISPGFKGLDTKLVRIYTGNQFNGYIFELKNTTKSQKLFVNVQNLMLGDPNLAVLSTADQNVLEAGDGASSKTYLRIVAKPTSMYGQLVLPVEVVEKRQSQ